MRKNLLYLIAVSLFVTFFASCTSTTSARLIPEDADMVASIDVKGSLETIGEEYIENLSKELKHLLKDSGVDRNTQNKIDEIIEDPMSLGIDLLKPIYVSLTSDDEDLYIVGSIRDKGNFEKTMEYLASEIDSDINEEGNYNYITIGGMILMYDGKSFVISDMYGEYDWDKDRYVYQEDESVEDLMALFNQKKSFIDTKSYKCLEREKGLAKLIITPEIFADEAFVEEFEYSDLDYSYYYDEFLSDMDIVFAANVDKGIATLSVAYDAGKNKDKVEGYAALNGTIEGSHVPYVSEDAIFVAAANLNGQNIWNSIVEVLKSQYGDEFEELKEEIDEDFEAELGVKLKDLIESFNGDVTFVVDGNLIGDDAIPEFDFYVATEDNIIAQLVSESFEMEEISNNKWEYPYYVDYEDDEIGKFSLIYKDNVSCVSFDEKKCNSFKESSEMIDKSLFKSKQFYARLNVQSLLDSKVVFEDEKLKELIKAEDEVLYELVESVDCIDMTSKDNRVECNLYTVDKTKTPVNILIDFVMQLI